MLFWLITRSSLKWHTTAVSAVSKKERERERELREQGNCTRTGYKSRLTAVSTSLSSCRASRFNRQTYTYGNLLSVRTWVDSPSSTSSRSRDRGLSGIPSRVDVLIVLQLFLELHPLPPRRFTPTDDADDGGERPSTKLMFAFGTTHPGRPWLAGVDIPQR